MSTTSYRHDNDIRRQQREHSLPSTQQLPTATVSTTSHTLYSTVTETVNRDSYFHIQTNWSQIDPQSTPCGLADSFIFLKKLFKPVFVKS